MRLFTALWVPPAAAAALRAVTTPDAVPAGWRAVDPETWHLTLAFHGEAEPEQLAPALQPRRTARRRPGCGCPAPAASAACSWVGVQAEPADRLARWSRRPAAIRPSSCRT